ncbi:MAG: hypothetical protein HYT78_12215 [Deltaproteobacteria bacterium]|nr:hypothetical protein [Deltaproteobacteria bacterium]
MTSTSFHHAAKESAIRSSWINREIIIAVFLVLLAGLAGCIPEIERAFIEKPLPPDSALAGPWVMKIENGGTMLLDLGARFGGDETAVLIRTSPGADGQRQLATNVFRLRRAEIGGRTWFEAESLGPDAFPEPTWTRSIQRFFGRYEITSGGQLRVVFPSFAALKEAITAGRLKGASGGLFDPRIMLRDEPAALRAFLAATPPPDGQVFEFKRLETAQSRDGSPEAAQQSDEELVRPLFERVAPEDGALRVDVSLKAGRKMATKGDVTRLFERASAYYANQNYFTAHRLFNTGTVAYALMGWEKDEMWARAAYVSAKSEKAFCEAERPACLAYMREAHKTSFPEMLHHFLIVVGLEEALERNRLRQDYQADAKKECAEARERLKTLVRQNPDFAPEQRLSANFLDDYKCGG